MKSPLFATALSLALTSFAAAADPRGDHPDASPLSPQEQLTKFHVPPGFEVQLVAAEPEIQKPINLTFDTAGRLWVTGSESYPWPAGTDAAGQPIPDFQKAYDAIADAFGARGKEPPSSPIAKDSVRILSELDASGHAQKIRVFADKLNIPSGVQPLPRKPGSKGDTAIVYSIPGIWRLEDTDGDGVADKREPLFKTFGFLDTHGGSSSYLYWIDGWIYGTHGFRNHSEVVDGSGTHTVIDSGNTYRFKPDGSHFELYTHGQTNPFGLTVDDFGNFFSADSHSKPVYMLLPGGWYEGIGKQHDGLGFAPRITDDDHGSSAIAGIAFYGAETFPAEFRGNLFNGNPVTQKINRDRLEWHGSTPKAIRMEDFLSCDDAWFRPVQVKLGPDGALYIADFYNPIIGHYEFPLADPRRDHTHGRIWRVVYRGENKKDAPALPDLTRLGMVELAMALGDPNLVVRTLATNQLVDGMGKDSFSLMLAILGGRAPGPITPWAAGHAIWALERTGMMNDGIFLPMLQSKIEADSDPEFVAQGIQLLAARPTLSSAQTALISAALFSKNAKLQRVAAAAIGRHPSNASAALPARLKGAPADDVELIHTLRMALRDYVGKPGSLDTIKNLTRDDEKMAGQFADVALSISTPESAEFVLHFLDRSRLNAPRAEEMLRMVSLNLAADRVSAVPKLLRELEAEKPVAVPKRLAAASGLADAARKRNLTLSEADKTWLAGVMIEGLSSTDEATLKSAIEAVREAKIDEKFEPLSRIIADPKRTGPIRAAALEAVANLDLGPAALAGALDDISSLTLRKRAAELLGQSAGKNPNVVQTLLSVLPKAPGELAVAIAAGLTKSDAGCTALLSVLEAGKASPALLRNKTVSAALDKRPQALRDRATVLTRDLPPEDTRLDGVIAKRVEDFRAAQNADAARGAQVFEANCLVCHRFKNNGGNVGPNLDGVAARGLHRLVEDILDPNRNIDPAFAQTLIETTDGKTYAGIGLHNEGELLVLNDVTGKPVSVPKSTVKSQTLLKLSLMPPAFESTLPAQDFNALIAFLLQH